MGRLFDILMNMVVSTSIEVKFTDTTASKKNGLKKLVAWPIMFKRIVGKNHELRGCTFFVVTKA